MHIPANVDRIYQMSLCYSEGSPLRLYMQRNDFTIYNAKWMGERSRGGLEVQWVFMLLDGKNMENTQYSAVIIASVK